MLRKEKQYLDQSTQDIIKNSQPMRYNIVPYFFNDCFHVISPFVFNYKIVWEKYTDNKNAFEALLLE